LKPLSKNIDDEDFDKDIALARLQVDATLWASMYSVLGTTSFALIAGAMLAMLAYSLTTPKPSISSVAFEGIMTVLNLGLFAAFVTVIGNRRRRNEREKEFTRISKKVKAEKEAEAPKQKIRRLR
jgi:hypothetical protein